MALNFILKGLLSMFRFFMDKDYCPACGSWEVYFENPGSGNGLYNCDDCEWEGAESKLVSGFAALFLRIFKRGKGLS